MSTITEYEEILGVKADAGADAIKRAYRIKAKQLHPDRNPSPDAHQQFILLQEAYDYLLNRKSAASKRMDEATYQYEWYQQRREEARERARQQARMRYEEYIQSDEFKSTSALTAIFDVIGFLVLLMAAIAIPSILLIKSEGVLFYILLTATLLASPYIFKILYKIKPDFSVFTESLQFVIKRKSFRFFAIIILNFLLFFLISLRTFIELKWIVLSYAIPIFIGYIVLEYHSKKRMNEFFRTFLWICIIPLTINSLYLINYIGSSRSETETYRYTVLQEFQRRRLRDTTTIVLPDNKYDRFHHIRFFADGTPLYNNNTITLEIANGLFGYKVLKHYRFETK